MTTALDINAAAVLARMATSPTRKWTNRDLARALGVSTTTTKTIFAHLTAIAAVDVAVIEGERRYTLPADEHAPVAAAGDLVPPFKPDMWKPPMRDYGSKLAAHATLAMLSRR